eukprot:1177084-Pleurochrysis_carterae.AAC.1
MLLLTSAFLYNNRAHSVRNCSTLREESRRWAHESKESCWLPELPLAGSVVLPMCFVVDVVDSHARRTPQRWPFS